MKGQIAITLGAQSIRFLVTSVLPQITGMARSVPWWCVLSDESYRMLQEKKKSTKVKAYKIILVHL